MFLLYILHTGMVHHISETTIYVIYKKQFQSNKVEVYVPEYVHKDVHEHDCRKCSHKLAKINGNLAITTNMCCYHQL